MSFGVSFPSIRNALPPPGPQFATPNFLSLAPQPALAQSFPLGGPLLPGPSSFPIGPSFGGGSLFPIGGSFLGSNLFPNNLPHLGSPFPLGSLSPQMFPLFPSRMTFGGNSLPGMGVPHRLPDLFPPGLPFGSLFPMSSSPFGAAAGLVSPLVGNAEFRQTPQPVTPQPVTPQPVTPQPVTPQPPQPVTPQPPQPVTPQPVTPQPVTPPPLSQPVTQKHPDLTSQQLDNLNFLREVAEKQSSTPAETRRINELFLSTPMDAQTMTEAKEIGENLAALLFSDPALVQTVNDWPNLTTAQRQDFISDFVEKASDYLGFDVGVRYFNTPAVNGQFPGGFYDANTNSLNVNTIPDAIGDASSTLQILVHELAHAFKSHEIGRISPRQIIERASNGDMSYTNALIGFANMAGIYKAPPEVDLNTYQHNMHEQFAFTTQDFFDEAAKPHGLTLLRETFTADHPLYRNLVAAGVA